jgi:hypothetical protein
MNSVSRTVEQAKDNLSNILEVESPRRTTELDTFIGVGSVYDPTTDTLEVNTEKEDNERIRSVENSLIMKYVVDQTIGDTGLEELNELESEVELYRAIEGFNILEENEREIRSSEEIDEELIGEHGEEMEEMIEEVREMADSRLEDDESPDIEDMREMEENTENLALDNLRKSIGKNEEKTRRLAALHLDDSFDEVIEEYRDRYQELEDKKEEASDEYWEEFDRIHNELETTVENEDVLEAAIEVKSRAMQFDLETGKVELNIDRELRGEETEKAGTSYTREDIAKAMRKEGVEDEELIDKVYNLFREDEQLEDEKDQKIRQYNERQTELNDELMTELDQTVEEMSQEIDLYIEPLIQRNWKAETLPIQEVSASLQTLYKAHEDGLLEGDRQQYEERLKAFVEQNYKSSGDINKHLEKVVDLYEMQEGSEEERLRATFEKAPEYAS